MQTQCMDNRQDNSGVFPKVGIFWLAAFEKDSLLIYFMQDLSLADHVDVYYDSVFEHVKCWQKVQKMFPVFEKIPYEKYPRGRITFVSKDYTKGGTFKLIADIKILQNEECIKELKHIYQISKNDVELLRDLHYRTK